MKRFCALVLFVLVLSTLSAGYAIKGEYTYGDYEYTILSDKTVGLTKYNGSQEVVKIPNRIKGMTVSAILAHLFYENKTITEVIVPSSVKTVDGLTFSNCPNLKKVILPASCNIELSDDGTPCSPFVHCDGLTDIQFSPANEHFEFIDNVLFHKDSHSLIYYPPWLPNESYSIPDGTQYIATCAFYDCPNLTELNIPDSVNSLPMQFLYKSNITKLIIPGSIKILANRIAPETKIRTLILQEGVETITQYSLSDFEKLEKLYIPASVTTIEDSGIWFFEKKYKWPTIYVKKDSYAEEYCKKEYIDYQYYEDADLLSDASGQ